MKNNSLSLLHQSPETLLTSVEAKLAILSLMVFFVKEIIDALELFYFKNNFLKFDPHVGDTLCQIRAYKLLSLNSNSDVFSIKNELKRLRLVYGQVIRQASAFQNIRNCKYNKYEKKLFLHQRLDMFLSEQGFIFELEADILFVMQSYFLTRFKKTTAFGDTYVDYEKICDEIQISRKSAKKISRHFQTMLANMSSAYVEKIWRSVLQERNLDFVFNYLKKIDDDGRLVLPCYPVMKILLFDIFKKNIPILVVVERQYLNYTDVILLSFFPKEGGDFYLLQDPQESLLKKPCMVIQGMMEYRTEKIIEPKKQFILRFMSFGLKHLILANMADHPQYSGNKLSDISFNPFKPELFENNKIFLRRTDCDNNVLDMENYRSIINAKALGKELLAMKASAASIGCCQSNPALFFIKHIFCDTIKNQLRIYQENVTRSDSVWDSPSESQYVNADLTVAL